MTQTEHALVEELSHVEGKAEIVHNRIVHFPMTGGEPGYAGDAILVSLHLYVRRTRIGVAVGDGKGFLVELPHRHSFSPDAAYHLDAPTAGFYEGAPVFAVEVRSENDYGAAAERDMTAIRADYFSAGTRAVWDVDVLSGNEIIVRFFRDGDAQRPAAVFRRGQIAHAEPAVPGWTMAVDDLFATPSPG